MKFLIAALLIAFSAPSNAADDKPLIFPKWLIVPFAIDTPLTKIYKNSIAQGVWVKTKKTSFLPPIQYFARPVSGAKLATHTQGLSEEILKNLGVKAAGKASSTVMLKSGAFRTNGRNKNEGYFAEYQSVRGTGIFVTCMAFVKMDKQVVAVYTQAFKNSLPKCSSELLDLAQWEHLDRSLPVNAKKYVPTRLAASK